jgi:hypothetical protein
MKDLTIHFLNCLCAGLLVFLGAASNELADHGFSEPKELVLGLSLGFLAAAIMFITKLQTVLQDLDVPTQKLGVFV